ncbi:PREDICTED: glutathione S-transferase omega-1-like [Branchiostoma belcheri]|uniref:Glutathione S-transferase omega n=1 Tax=Branchiostoma belcheri TaxID=7741 RepID=A0A6P4XF00_BRABE|nr:PREDICTED: glutathione S-transferase omega-1-like [Branchiostoma belcheri]
MHCSAVSKLPVRFCLRSQPTVKDMLSEKAMKTGSACPPPPGPGKLRLYSMRFCPYAQRTRLFLAAKGIEYETINIHLREKPEWFLEKTPMGQVPVLEKDGDIAIVYESLVCNEYLDGIYPDKCITPRDPLEKARQSMVLALWGAKVIPVYYKLVIGKDDERPAMARQFVDGLEYIESALTQPFFSGDDVGALDYNLWPWFERVPMLKARAGVQMSAEKLPKLTAWMERMSDLPEVKACSFSPEIHDRYGKTLLAGRSEYDLGLEE